MRFIVALLRLVDFPPLFVALTKLRQLLTMHSDDLLPKNLATFLIHLLLSLLSDFSPCLARTILIFKSHNAVFTILQSLHSIFNGANILLELLQLQQIVLFASRDQSR